VVGVVVASEQLVLVVLMVDGEKKYQNAKNGICLVFIPATHPSTIRGTVARLNKLQSIFSYAIALLAVLRTNACLRHVLADRYEIIPTFMPSQENTNGY
jgi:hypothetical protein